MNKINVNMQWVDRESLSTAELPESWVKLIEEGFHPDLVERAQAYFLYAKDHDFLENALAVLESIGQGFLNPFDDTKFRPKESDPDYALKNKCLDGLIELRGFYGDRVSSLFWDAFAHLATRQDPEVEKSIIKEAGDGTLPDHYTVIDSALHASGIVYTFMLHVNSVMFKHTGRILNHNCDCGCSLINLEEVEGHIEYTLPAERIERATESILTHILAETVKLQELFLPFAFGITPEAEQIKVLM